jgi:hypothetical protein
VTSGLVKYEAARQALAEAHRVDEAKAIRDKLRAERWVGELLRETGETGQRQSGGKPSSRDDGFKTLRLADLDITPDQSPHWQKLATIPEPEFETIITSANGDAAAMTPQQILNRRKSTRQVAPRVQPPPRSRVERRGS